MDPDLLLAIALSQTLMEGKIKHKRELTSLQKKQLEELIECLCKNENYFENQYDLGQLKFLYPILSMIEESTSLDFEQIKQWVKLLQLLSATLFNLGTNQSYLSKSRNISESIQSTFFSILRFCVVGLERFFIGANRSKKKDYLSLINELFELIELLCLPSKIPDKVRLSNLKAEFQPKALNRNIVFNVESQETEEDNPAPNLLVSNAIEQLLQSSLQQTNERKRDTLEEGHHYVLSQIRENTFYFLRKLDGASRILSFCDTCILNNGKIQNKLELAQIEESFSFVEKVFRFLNDISSEIDPTTIVNVVQLISSFVSIVRTERSQSLTTHSMITKSILESILKFINQKLHISNSIYRNIQVIFSIVLLETLDSFKIADLLKRNPEEIEPYSPKLNHEHLSFALELLGNVLEPGESSLSHFVLPENPPIVAFTLGPNKNSFNCFSDLSKSEMIEFIFKNQKVALLDKIFLIMFFSFSEIMQNKNQPTYVQLAPQEMDLDTEDFGMQNLFSEKDNIKLREPEIENQSLRYLSVFKLLDSLFSQKSGVLSNFLRQQMNENHIKVLLFICHHQGLLLKEIQKDFRQLYSKIIINNFLSDELQNYALSIRSFPKEWPLFISPEKLAFLATILLKRVQNKNLDEVNSILWKGFLQNLQLGIEGDQKILSFYQNYGDPINLENIYLLLFLFYTFDEKHKIQVIKSCLDLLRNVASTKTKGETISRISLLCLARLILIIDYILHNFVSMPEKLISEFESIFFSQNFTTQLELNPKHPWANIDFFQELIEKDIPVSAEAPQPNFYLLLIHSIEQHSLGIQELTELDDRQYARLYTNLCNLLDIKGKIETTRDALAIEYYFDICWHFLRKVQPSSTFLESLRQPKQWNRSNTTLHCLRYLLEVTLSNEKDPDNYEFPMLEHFKASLVLLKDISTNFLENQSFSHVHSLVDYIVLFLKKIFASSSKTQPIEKRPKKRKKKTKESPPKILLGPLMEIANALSEDVATLNELVAIVFSLIQVYTNFFRSQMHQIFVAKTHNLHFEKHLELIQFVFKANLSKEGLDKLLELNNLQLDISSILEKFSSLKPEYATLDKNDSISVSERALLHSSPYNIFSIQHVLTSLVSLGRSIISSQKKSSFLTDKTAFTILVTTLVDISGDKALKFLSVDCNSIFDILFHEDQRKFLKSIQKLHHINELLNFLLYNHDAISYDSVEPLFLDALSELDQIQKNSATNSSINFYYFDYIDQNTSNLQFLSKGNLTTLFKLLLNNSNENINISVLRLFNSIVKNLNAENCENFANQLFKLDITLILEQKLLSSSSSTSVKSLVSSFLEVIVPNLSGANHHLFSSLLTIFDTSFMVCEDGKEFFHLLKKIAFQLGQQDLLLSHIISLLSSNKIAEYGVKEPMVLILKFLFTIMQKCYSKGPMLKSSFHKSTSTKKKLTLLNPEERMDEKELANKLCTFTQTSSNFTEQHWYYCYTCNLTFSEGCCSICVMVCHAGHEVSYSRFSRFFCDCGAGASRGIACKAMKPRLPVHSQIDENPSSPIQTSSDFEVSLFQSNQEDVTLIESLSKEERNSLIASLRKFKLSSSLLQLYLSLIKQKKDLNKKKNEGKEELEDILSSDKNIVTEAEFFQMKRMFKAGSFEVRLKIPQNRDLRNLLSSQSVTRNIISANSSEKLAIAEADSVIIADISNLLRDGSPLDKNAYKVISKTLVGFPVMGILFNREYEQYLLVYGLKECRILTLNSKTYEVDDQLEINLSLDNFEESSFIVQSHWIPGSMTKVAIVTNRFVKIYDLSKDSISPMQYYYTNEDSIKEVTFIQENEHLFMILITEKGNLYSQSLLQNTDGPLLLSKKIQVPPHLKGSVGGSVYYSPSRKILFVSYGDSKCFAGRLDQEEHATLVGAFPLYVSRSRLDPNNNSKIPYNLWMEFPQKPEITFSVSKKSNFIVGVKISKEEIHVQAAKLSLKINSKIEGITVIQVSPKVSSLLVMIDDGSLLRYDRLSAPNDIPTPTDNDIRELIKPKLQTKAIFPITFFEKVECITPSITLAGDVLQHYTSEVAKQRLSSNDEYIVLCSSKEATDSGIRQESFDLIIKNPNPDLVIVGIRVLLGSASLPHIPRELRVFNRVIKTSEGIRRWYDIPFTPLESILGEKEVTLTASNTFNTEENEPIIDSLEVYGLSKQEFGWKQKLEELRNTSLEGKTFHDPLENILILLLDLLTLYYSNEEISKKDQSVEHLLKEIPQILTDFSDFLFLRPSAKQLLQILKQDKAEYHELKDTLQLSHFASNIKQKMNNEVFSRYTKIVSKIILHRPQHFRSVFKKPQDFVQNLVNSFWLIISPQIPNFVDSINRMIDILYGFGLDQESQMTEMINNSQLSITHLKNFLSASNDSIRNISAQRLSRLLGVKTITELSDSKDSTSFQFSCDQCKKLISDKRYSCNICPDFDLCSSCYEKGGPYPEPHNESHPLTEHTENKKNLENLLQLVPPGVDLYDYRTLLDMGKSLSLASEQTTTLPSSKPTYSNELKISFNKLLFESLLKDFPSIIEKGGYASLPSMQIIYCLIRSVSTSPALVSYFIQSLIRCFDEYFLKKQFLVNPLTPQLEVQILYLMILSFLMSDGETVIKEELKNQLSKNSKILDFFCSILQSLFDEKVPQTIYLKENTIPSGALLVPKYQGFKMANFLPFFNEEYIRKHPSNFFSEYQQLLAETIFKIGISLNQFSTPEPIQGFSPVWMTLLCSYINSNQNAFIRNSAKKLLQSISQDKEKYYHIRDNSLFLREFKQLRAICEKENFDFIDLSYENQVLLIQSLSNIFKIASRRPHNWQLFILEGTESLSFLLKICYHLHDDPLLFCFKLIVLVFSLDETTICQILEDPSTKTKTYESKKGKQKTLVCSSKTKEQIQHKIPEKIAFFFENEINLSHFIDRFLLESNVSSIRNASSALIHRLWLHSSKSQRSHLFSLLSNKLDLLPASGINASEFVELFCFVISQAHFIDSSQETNFIDILFKTLQSQNQLLANHSNSALYTNLSKFLDLCGYYLESRPCLVCNDPEFPWTQVSLEALKMETKFTANTFIVKLKDSYLISSFSLHISDVKKAKMIQTINFYYNNKPVADIGELKNKWSSWKKARSLSLTPSQTDVKIEFIIPISACNIMIEYASFYENLQALATEKLQCPRCSSYVTDKHGICSRCRENAFQCRQCRNINYEDPQAFLCNECGYCKWGRFDYVMDAKISFASEKIETEEDFKKKNSEIEKESESAYVKFQQLMEFKKQLIHLDSTLSDPTEESKVESTNATEKVNKKILSMATIYEKNCKGAFDSLSKNIQILLAARKELIRYLNSKQRIKEPPSQFSKRTNTCFGCANAFIDLSLTIFKQLGQNERFRTLLIKRGLIQELLENNLSHGNQNTKQSVREIICSLTKRNLEGLKTLNEFILTKLKYALHSYKSLDLGHFIRNEILLLTESLNIHDFLWEERLKTLLEFLFTSIHVGYESPVLSEHIILPCFSIILELCKIPTHNLGKVKPQTTSDLSYPLWSSGLQSFTQWKQKNQEKNRQNYLAIKYFQKWKTYIFSKKQVFSPISIKGNWLKQLLFSPCSQEVRSKAASLIDYFCKLSLDRTFMFLDFFSFTLIKEASKSGDCSAEFFTIFKSLISPPDYKIYLTVKKFLPLLCSLILEEVEQINKSETTFIPDLTQGFVLKSLLDILVSFLEIPSIKQNFKSNLLIEKILDAFLSLRGIIVQKNKLIDDSCKILFETLQKLNSETPEDHEIYMRYCINALHKYKKEDGNIITFIFEQLCNIVCPTKPEPIFSLTLHKSPTQEEFIRGNMTNNPYSSTDIGTLMRDVKNKICTTLDLRGLLEDDNSMELLVCNKIIKLDLSIRQVYEQVWKKSILQNSDVENAGPMIIVYRLQGLDGEATEEIIDSLPDSSEDDQRDPEEEYRISSLLSEYGALEEMIHIISRFYDFDIQYDLACLVLKLLMHASKIKVNCQTLLRLGGINLLLKKLKLAFSQETHPNLAEYLLLTIEKIVQEVNSSTKTGRSYFGTWDRENGAAQMKMFLEKLSVGPLVKSNPAIVKTVSRILPFLTYGEDHIISILIDYFLPYLNFEIYDQKEKDEDFTLHMECFSNVCENIALDETGNKLKSIVFQKGITKNLIQYVKLQCAHYMEIESQEWINCLSKPSLSYVLRQLKGLAQNHSETQKLILTEGILPILHTLERTTAVKKVGNLAENLLECLSDEYSIKEMKQAVKNIRLETQKTKSQKAQQHRQKILKELHLQQKENGKITTDQKPNIIEDLEEESGLKCMVCQEGYKFRSLEVLGLYTFSKKIQLNMIENKNRTEYGYSTVSNFNTIHVQCHKEATKAERLLKPPKEEWQGATIRNQHTKCNNLFPLLGPNTPLDSYIKSLEEFWTNLSNLGRCESPRFKLLAHDLKILLLYYAKQEPLSAHTHGGSQESNLKFILCMLQMGLFILDQKSGAQRRVYEKTLSQFLAQGIEFWVNSSFQVDNTHFNLVLSLYLQSLEEWKASKFLFLKRILAFVFAEQTDKLGKTDLSFDEKTLFHCCRPVLLFFSLIDKLQLTLKKESNQPAQIGPISHKLEEKWILTLKQSLMGDDLKTFEKMNEIFAQYENEMIHFDSLSEFFDDLGVLPQVLNEAKSDKEFMEQFFSSLKSSISTI